MDPYSGDKFLMMVSVIIMAVNLIILVLPIYKMIKKEIRCYQTPFLFVFAGTAEFLLHLGVLIFLTNIPSTYGIEVVSIMISIIMIFVLAIIFGDQEFSIGIKFLILLGFLALESLFFLASLMTPPQGLIYFLYIIYSLFSIGPIECLIGCIICKKYSILPILNLFLLLVFNILRVIATISYSYIFILYIIGGVSCLAQIILYFVFKATRKISSPVEINNIEAQINNVSSEPFMEKL